MRTRRSREDGGVDALSGKLLIAGPSLFDPNFRRSILLVADHDEQGAVGVILNRPADVTVKEAAPDLGGLVGAGERLFVGGPVQPQAAVVVAEFEEPGHASLLAFGAIGFLTGEEPESVRGIRRARVFAGYAGWGPGQLEQEMEHDSWITEPALPEDVFTADPEGLWGAVLLRKGREFRLLANMPFDPSSN
jgi:putative transcriptional regulator